MDILWKQGSVPVRTVVSTLKPKRSLAYTTVMTVMNRLVDKGLLRRKAQVGCYCYEPATPKATYMARASRQVIDQLIRQYGAIAVAEFLDRLDITDPRLLRRLRERFSLPREK